MPRLSFLLASTIQFESSQHKVFFIIDCTFFVFLYPVIVCVYTFLDSGLDKCSMWK